MAGNSNISNLVSALFDNLAPNLSPDLCDGIGIGYMSINAEDQLFIWGDYEVPMGGSGIANISCCSGLTCNHGDELFFSENSGDGYIFDEIGNMTCVVFDNANNINSCSFLVS